MYVAYLISNYRDNFLLRGLFLICFLVDIIIQYLLSIKLMPKLEDLNKTLIDDIVSLEISPIRLQNYWLQVII